MFQPMMLYQIKNCVIDLYKCKKFEKEEVMTPFHKSGDDDWQDAKGNFKIIIDDDEFSYETLQQRDCVFTDIMSKLMTCYTDANGIQYTPIIYTDRQALANLPL